MASKEIILCEPLIDALTSWCAGYRNVTASYGVNGFTEDHKAAFRRHGTRKVFIAYDRDVAGEAAAKPLLKLKQKKKMRKPRILGRPRKKDDQKPRAQAPMDALSASLCSENDRMKSALEMTPRGKRGKLKPRVSHSFHRTWIPTNYVGNHISTAPAAGLYQQKKDNNEVPAKFQLTHQGRFQHHTGQSLGAYFSGDAELFGNPASTNEHASLIAVTTPGCRGLARSPRAAHGLVIPAAASTETPVG